VLHGLKKPNKIYIMEAEIHNSHTMDSMIP